MKFQGREGGRRGRRKEKQKEKEEKHKPTCLKPWEENEGGRKVEKGGSGK